MPDQPDCRPAEPEKSRPDQAPRVTVATWLVIAAAGWYLLRELAGLLRPLFFAVFLAYIILPVHLRLRRRIPAFASVAVMVGASVGLLYLLVLLVPVAQRNVRIARDVLRLVGVSSRRDPARRTLPDRVQDPCPRPPLPINRRDRAPDDASHPSVELLLDLSE